jgi:hypothetical protein
VSISTKQQILRVDWEQVRSLRTSLIQPSFRLTSFTSSCCRPTLVISNDLLGSAVSTRARWRLDFGVAAELGCCSAETKLGTAHIQRACLLCAPLRSPARITVAFGITGAGAVCRRAVVGPQTANLSSCQQMDDGQSQIRERQIDRSHCSFHSTRSYMVSMVNKSKDLMTGHPRSPAPVH